MADETTDNPLLVKLKLSLRIDGDDDNTLLTGFLETAKQFVIGSIGSADNGFYDTAEAKTLVETAQLALASSYYQNRSSLSATPIVSVDLVVNSIIGQLRGRYDVFAGGDANGTQSEPKSDASTS